MRASTTDKLIVVGFVLACLVGALIIGAGVVFGVKSAMHTQTRVCTVTAKERVYDMSSKSRTQRVYTRQCGTLKVADSLWDGHFDSADTWGQIEKGHTYRMKTRGLRIGLFSMFPNIVSVQEVQR